MPTSLRRRLQTLIEAANERECGLPDRKSANVSRYQLAIMLEITHGRNPIRTSTDLPAVHGGHGLELARALEAYAQLLRSNVESAQP